MPTDSRCPRCGARFLSRSTMLDHLDRHPETWGGGAEAESAARASWLHTREVVAAVTGAVLLVLAGLLVRQPLRLVLLAFAAAVLVVVFVRRRRASADRRASGGPADQSPDPR